MLIPIITPIVLLILFRGYWSQFFSEKSVIMSADDFSRKKGVSGNGGGKTKLCKHSAGCAQRLPGVVF